jgi:hypothetical protein
MNNDPEELGRRITELEAEVKKLRIAQGMAARDTRNRIMLEIIVLLVGLAIAAIYLGARDERRQAS